jgi:hypothetical protein
MVMRLVAIVLIAIALVGIFGNLSPQGNLEATFQSLQASMATVAYAGEFDEIKISVDEFMYLRTIRGTEEGKALAEKIDERLNNLELVKMYCDEEISTLNLVNENNPYEKIQQVCPKLQEISLSKAAQLFGLI